jgi:hypothetical protein
MRRFRERFGRPVAWRGDPFQTVVSWKWSFNDARGDRSTWSDPQPDDDYKTGNFVKMTLLSLWRREDACQ